MKVATADEPTLVAVGEVVNICEASGRLWEPIFDSTLCFYHDGGFKG